MHCICFAFSSVLESQIRIPQIRLLFCLVSFIRCLRRFVFPFRSHVEGSKWDGEWWMGGGRVGRGRMRLILFGAVAFLPPAAPTAPSVIINTIPSSSRVLEAIFSPDSKLIASGSVDKKVRIYSVRGGSAVDLRYILDDASTLRVFFHALRALF